MQGRYSITVRFDIFQTLENVQEVLDVHQIAESAACELSDLLTDHRAAVTFEIVDSSMEVKQ